MRRATARASFHAANQNRCARICSEIREGARDLDRLNLPQSPAPDPGRGRRPVRRRLKSEPARDLGDVLRPERLRKRVEIRIAGVSNRLGDSDGAVAGREPTA
jgi:hypothetical protein